MSNIRIFYSNLVTNESQLILFPSIIVTSIVYPVSTHWCWGSGGWLASMGFYDFAGSGVVHVAGGIHALIGIINAIINVL